MEANAGEYILKKYLNLMGERFTFVTEEITLLVDKVVPENTKKSTSYAVNVFDGNLKRFVNVSSNLALVLRKIING